MDRTRIVPIQMLVSSRTARGVPEDPVAAEEPLAKVIAERTGADPLDLYPHVLAAAVTAAVRAATGHWMATGAAAPSGPDPPGRPAGRRAARRLNARTGTQPPIRRTPCWRC